MPDKEYLLQMQSLPLEAKVIKTELRIREWYEHWDGNVYVSFSGGKDSTVLAHIVHDLYPEVPLVFCNTGLEYPEIQNFARKMGAEFVRPKMQFAEVISTYGYPIIGKEVAEAIHYARVIKNGGAEQKLTGSGISGKTGKLPLGKEMERKHAISRRLIRKNGENCATQHSLKYRTSVVMQSKKARLRHTADRQSECHILQHWQKKVGCG